jgi:hypothetical protein
MIIKKNHMFQPKWTWLCSHVRLQNGKVNLLRTEKLEEPCIDLKIILKCILLTYLLTYSMEQGPS